MKVEYAIVRKKTHFPLGGQGHSLSAYHATMFHGVAQRNGEDTECVEFSRPSGLRYLYNVSSGASVVCPKSRLLVMSRLVDPAWERQRHISLIPVDLVRCVDVPFGPDNEDWVRVFRNRSDYKRTLLKEKPVPKPEWFSDFLELNSKTIVFDVDFDRITAPENRLSFDLSGHVCEEDVAFFGFNFQALRVDLFGKVVESLVRDYFDVAVVNVTYS